MLCRAWTLSTPKNFPYVSIDLLGLFIVLIILNAFRHLYSIFMYPRFFAVDVASCVCVVSVQWNPVHVSLQYRHPN